MNINELIEIDNTVLSIIAIDVEMLRCNKTSNT